MLSPIISCASGPPGHRNRLEPVELPPQFLPFFPGKKFRNRHRLTNRNTHDQRFSIPTGSCRWFARGREKPPFSYAAAPFR